jgi:predicted Zn-dependent protease
LNVRKLASASVLLIAMCSTLVFASFLAQAQTEYTIEIRGYTWDHSTVTVSVLPQQNISWWKPEYLNATLQGISQWNDAIQEFAQTNPSFSFLSDVTFVPTISYEVVSGFDVYMGWIEECGSEEVIGQTQTTVMAPCHSMNSSVCLAAKAPSGHVMTEVDMQNIVVHELGHVLGLSHTNVSTDAMYPTVYYQSTVKPLSTLDIYGVAKLFEFMTKDTCPEEELVTMPQSISYSHLEIAPENIPSQSLTEYAIRLLTQPEVLIIVIAALAVVVALLARQRKKLT